MYHCRFIDKTDKMKQQNHILQKKGYELLSRREQGKIYQFLLCS